MIEIPQDEMRALEAALFGGEVGRPEGVYSTAELAERFGISETGMRKKLGQAIKDGVMERVKFVEMDSTGRRQPRTGYRLMDNDRD